MNRTMRAILAAMAMGLAASVQADQNWNNGAGDYNWFNTNNWNGHALPGNGDIASISNNCSDANPVLVSGSVTGCAKQVRLGYGAGDAGYLWVQSGGITNNNNNSHYVGYSGTGNLRVSGGLFQPLGTLSFGSQASGQGVGMVDGGSVSSSWDTVIGDAGTGCVTVTSGSVTVGSGRTLYLGNTNTGVGTLVLSNGVITLPSTGKTYLGNYGTGSVDVEGGNLLGGYFYIGKQAGGVGTLLVGQGSVTGQNAFVVGDAGVGSVTQTGGVVGTINTGITVGNAAGSSGSYALSNGLLSVSAGHLILGNAAGSTGTCSMAGGTLAVGGTFQLQVGASGTGLFTQVGGTVSVVREFYLGMNAGGSGTYLLRGGSFAVGTGTGVASVGGAGQGYFRQECDANFNQGLTIGNSAGGTGIYDMATVTLATGAGKTMMIGALGDGTCYMHGGTATLTGVGGSLLVRTNAGAKGLLSGWGKVATTTGVLRNGGMIVADGYGTNQDLDLTSLTSALTWSNLVENTTTNGYYARNKGRLLMKNVTVGAGNSTNWWGELAAGDPDGVIDLVNSMSVTLIGTASSATLTVSLLAPDRTDVVAPNGAAAGRTFIGVWTLALNKAFTSAALQFRYDDYVAGSQSLRLCRYDTGLSTWVQVPSTTLSGSRLNAAVVTSFGLYAIAAAPTQQGTVIQVR